MENRHLTRSIDRFRMDFDSVIEQLIAEIEMLEDQADEMADRIKSLETEVEELNDVINDLKG